MKIVLTPCVVFVFGALASLSAQETPPSSVVVSNEKPLVLDPFVVNTDTDVGYTAVASLAGGRNNTP